MKKSVVRSDMMLALASIIWGFGFVAQKEGMEHLDPYSFNAYRFALGSIIVLAAALVFDSKKLFSISRKDLVNGCITGTMLFLASVSQQAGLVYTTAGNAGFITGLYVVLVPALGFIMWRQKTSRLSILGAVLATVGLYLLSINYELEIKYGDLLILVSAFFWACQVILVGRFSPKMSSFVLALVQFSFCSLLSFIMVLINGVPGTDSVISSSYSLLYSGVLSVGVAFTLQVVGQKKSPPAHAAIIMSLEALFAVLGGWLFLSETITARILIGCAFMLSGMLLSQVRK